MIKRLVKLTLDPGKVKDFLKSFELVKNRIRAFKGCKHLELLSDRQTPGILFTLSIWETDADFEAYRSSELFTSTWKQVKPMFIDKAEAWSLVITDEVGVTS